MFYYEKDNSVRAIEIKNDALGRKYISFFSVDKDKLTKRHRIRFIIGSFILALCFALPLIFIDHTIGAIFLGASAYLVISAMTVLDGCSIASLFFKDSAMQKFKLDLKLWKAHTDNHHYILVHSDVFADGTAGFWNKFMEITDKEILQEAGEIAVQESILKDAIAGMKNYIKETSESAIRSEVFHKLEVADEKYKALINRFNDFENTVLRASDSKRDGKVLKYMEMIDELDSQAD